MIIFTPTHHGIDHRSHRLSPHPCISIPRRLHRIVVGPLLDVFQELPVERNNDAFLSIFAGGGANIAIEVDGAHYTFDPKRIKTEIGELNALDYSMFPKKTCQSSDSPSPHCSLMMLLIASP